MRTRPRPRRSALLPRPNSDVMELNTPKAVLYCTPRCPMLCLLHHNPRVQVVSIVGGNVGPVDVAPVL